MLDIVPFYSSKWSKSAVNKHTKLLNNLILAFSFIFIVKFARHTLPQSGQVKTKNNYGLKLSNLKAKKKETKLSLFYNDLPINNSIL